MQHQVPQFIDRETKLVGPLTGRQLIIFGAVAFILFVLYFIVPFFVLILVGTVLVSVAVSLAFIRVNNRPLADVMFSFFNYLFRPRIYIWQKTEPTKEQEQKRTKQVLEKAYTKKEEAPEEEIEKNTEEEKIKNLADILNQ